MYRPPTCTTTRRESESPSLSPLSPPPTPTGTRRGNRAKGVKVGREFSFGLSAVSAALHAVRDSYSSMPCATAECCSRHPRACSSSLPKESLDKSFQQDSCQSLPRTSSKTAILTTATPDVVTAAAWSEFDCRFRAIGDVYVGSPSEPPCLGRCAWRFVRVARKLSGEPWGHFVLKGLRTVWLHLQRREVPKYKTFVSARADMHWLIEPRLLVVHIRSDIQRRHGFPLSAPPDTPRAAAAADTRRAATPLVYLPDTENWWGANDRFAVCNRAAAEAYFNRASLIKTHDGNTETLLAAALKRANAAILLVPTLGTLACCTAMAFSSCNSRVCARVWVNESGGREFSVKYIFEAQAAIQNAEVLLRAQSRLVPCEAAAAKRTGAATATVTSLCERPRSPNSPHHCLPVQALCLWPKRPVIAWRALWHRNASDWYRWLSRPPWVIK